MVDISVTTALNHDSVAALGLNNGDDYNINGGSLTINADARWGQNAAVLGSVTISATAGGSLLIDGREIWEINFDASTGNVPALGELGDNAVTGSISGATGELFRVWDSTAYAPLAAGVAMPATGWIKLRSKTGTFLDNESITLPGGATITVNSATGGKRSWIQVPFDRIQTITVPRLGDFVIRGDWYELGVTDGNDDQTFAIPMCDTCPGIWVETAPGSNVFDRWAHAANRWDSTSPQFVPTDSRGRFFGQRKRLTDSSTTSGSPVVTTTNTDGIRVGDPVVSFSGFSSIDRLYVTAVNPGVSISVSANANATGVRSMDVIQSRIQIAQRTGGICGLKPPAGCRVRVPNVVISVSVTPFASQCSVGTPADRIETATAAAGVIDFERVWFNGYLNAVAAYSVRCIESSFAITVNVSNTASDTRFQDVIISPEIGREATVLSLSSLFSGAVLDRVLAVRYASASSASNCIAVTDCASVDITDCDAVLFGGSGTVTRGNTNIRALVFTRCVDVHVARADIIGGRILLDQTVRATLDETRFADILSGETTTTNPLAAIEVTNTSADVYIDGFSAFDDLANVHPYTAILLTSASASSVEFRNLGTADNPYNAGTANAMGVLVSSSVTLGLTMRRLYANNMRTAALALSNTVQNVVCDNVWADGDDVQAIPAVNMLVRGCRWTNTTSGQSAVYGSHWQDFYTSDTTGRYVIMCNEPLPATAGQAVLTAGLGSGWTSTGSVSLSTAGYNVVWTMPYFPKGHTSFAPLPPSVTGTNISNHRFDYQIDTGAGFGSYKRLVCFVVRASGGTVGTNTFVFAAKPSDIPIVGEYIQSGSNRLPPGTTVTDVTGTTVTVSNNFLSTLGTNEIVITWKDIQDEAPFDPSNCPRLRIKGEAVAESATNALSYIFVHTLTNATDYKIPQPLPVILPTLTINELVIGSRLLIRRTDTQAVLVNTVVGATTYAYAYTYSSDAPIEIVVRNATGSPTYQEWRTTTTLTAADAAITAAQLLDE